MTSRYSQRENMIDSAILEVIIGLIFIYSLLSILVTQINGVLTSIFKLRADHLRKGISQLVIDPIVRAKVLTHPLIRLVQGDMTLPDQKVSDEQALAIANGVAWINADTFVNVLINVIRVDSDKELFGALLNIIDGMPANQDRRRLRLIVNQIVSSGDGLEDLRIAISELKEPIYREALAEALDQIDDEVGRLGLEPNSIVSVMAGLRNVKNQYLRSALETVLATSKTLDEAETKLKNWFDEGMGRATEAFKSKMLAISIVIGAIIAILGNVDSVNIARTLWDDPALRQLVSETAKDADVRVLQQQYDIASAAAQGEEVDANTGTAAVTARASEAYNTVNTLLQLRLPLGWRYTDLSALDPNISDNSALFSDANNLWNYLPGSPNWLSVLLTKIGGIFLTIIAIAQGAPFWFDLLRKVSEQAKNNVVRN
jgi:hypothetical protein